MRKLFLYVVIFTISAVFQIAFMRDSAVDGIAIIEKRAVLMAAICNTASVVLAYFYIRAENRKARQEIRRIERKIAINEAKQRRLLREMNSYPVRPAIRNKLPRQ